MPQLDITTYSTQIFWLLVCFSALFIITKGFIVPNMDNVFSNRLRHINLLLDQANKLAEEAKQLDKDIDEFVENSKLDIAIHEEETMKRLNVELEKMQEEFAAHNEENRAAAAISIEESMKDLASTLEKEVPNMVQLAYEVMYSHEESE